MFPFRKLLIVLYCGIFAGCSTGSDRHKPFPTEKIVFESEASTAPNPEIKPVAPELGKQTLTGTMAYLLGHNPDIAIAGAREREQFFGVKVAEAARMPNVEVNISAGPQHVFIPETGGDAIRREVTASLRQTIFDFGATRNDIQRATSAHASASSARLAKTEDIARSMLEAYLDVKKADELIAVTKRNMASHQKILQLVSLTADKGSGTVADVKRITSRLENTKTDLIDLTTQRSDAADAFRNLTDFDVAAIDGRGLERLAGTSPSLDDAQLEANPLVLAINQEIESLKYQLASVKAGKMPVIGLQGAVKCAMNVNSADSSDQQLSTYALATLKIPLFDGGLIDGQQGQIQSRLESAMFRLEKQKRDLRQQSESVMRLADPGEDKKGSLKTRVEASRKVADLTLEQFKSGGKSLFELLDAQSEFYKSEAELVRQKYERMKSNILALQLTGKLVEAILALHPDDSGVVLNKKADAQTTSSVPKQPIPSVAPVKDQSTAFEKTVFVESIPDLPGVYTGPRF